MATKVGGKFSSKTLRSPEGYEATPGEKKKYEESLVSQRASAIRRALEKRKKPSQAQFQEVEDADTGGN